MLFIEIFIHPRSAITTKILSCKNFFNIDNHNDNKCLLRSKSAYY